MTTDAVRDTDNNTNVIRQNMRTRRAVNGGRTAFIGSDNALRLDADGVEVEGSWDGARHVLESS